MSIPKLETELTYFEDHKEALLLRAPDKYALIKGSACIDVFDSVENAYEAAATMFSGEPFLIKQILADEQIIEIPAFCTGLINATL